MKRRASPEQVIHRSVVQHFRQRGASGMIFWHTPNGGKRRPVEAAIFNCLGVRAGVSDIIAVHKVWVFGLELKADGGRPTAAQMAFISDLNAAGGFGCIASGIDEAIRVLERWGLLKGTAA